MMLWETLYVNSSIRLKASLTYFCKNSMKKPFGKLYKKKKSNNTKGPFEDETTVEFFSLKNDAALFMYGGSSKKRLHNLIVGMPLFSPLSCMLALFDVVTHIITRQSVSVRVNRQSVRVNERECSNLV